MNHLHSRLFHTKEELAHLQAQQARENVVQHDSNTSEPALFKADISSHAIDTSAENSHENATLEDEENYHVSASRVGLVLAVIVICMLWVKQKSLTDYVQQTYQTTPFWQQWQHPAWKAGNYANALLNNSIGISSNTTIPPVMSVSAAPSEYQDDKQDDSVETENKSETALTENQLALNTPQPIQEAKTAKLASPVSASEISTPNEAVSSVKVKAETETKELVKLNKLENQTKLPTSDNVNNNETDKEQSLNVENTSPQFLEIQNTQKVFFVGDSLMEGIAPKAMRILRKKHGVKSINHSKQNTGLSYSNFFNWPKDISHTFAEHDDIGVMVVLIGANDPWDVPNPKNPAKYIKFKSKRWNKLYKNKVKQILATAKASNAHVLWLLMPAMKRNKLNKEVTHLNTLYLQAVTEFNQDNDTLVANAIEQQQRLHETNKTTAQLEQQIAEEESKLAAETAELAKETTNEEVSPKQNSEKQDNATSEQINTTENSDQTVLKETTALVVATQPLVSNAGIAKDFSNLLPLSDMHMNEVAQTMTFEMNTQINGTLKKARTSDGIHFSLSGQKHLANAIVHFIKVTPK